MIDGLFIVLVGLPLITEAITELVCVSNIFEPIRVKLREFKSGFINELLECKYCMSVWVAAFVVTLYCFMSWHGFIWWFFSVVLVHRLSNTFHNIGDIIYDYKTWRWVVRAVGDSSKK